MRSRDVLTEVESVFAAVARARRARGDIAGARQATSSAVILRSKHDLAAMQRRRTVERRWGW